MSDTAEKTQANGRRRSMGGMHPLFWLFGLIAAAWFSRLMVSWNQSVPPCGFRTMTGVPCPLCGGTRAMKLISEFDLLGAIQFNPLVGLGVIAIVLWLALKFADSLFGCTLESRVSQALAIPWLAFAAVGLVLANWAYLILFLP